jgi:hypothetical protein
VTSIRSRSWPDAVTSRPVTEPPEDSTAVVIELTALPRAGNSIRTVIEFDTLGAVAIDVLLPCGVAAVFGVRAVFEVFRGVLHT